MLAGMRARPGWLQGWLDRHQDRRSFALHMIGIPLTVAALVIAGVQLTEDRWDLWWRPTGMLFVGYVLQWIGHRLEGNTMGEVILIRKWRGRPYIAISPRFQKNVEPNENRPLMNSDKTGR